MNIGFNNNEVKLIFNNVLNKIKIDVSFPNILEISNDTSISIIIIKQKLNNSSCYYINEILNKYYKNLIDYNLKKSNLLNKINIFLTKINHKLIDFYNNNLLMNLIHINCYNFEYELYLYLDLTFNILNYDGILILTNCNSIIKTDIINKFINNNNNNITILNEKYCFVIQKNKKF